MTEEQQSPRAYGSREVRARVRNISPATLYRWMGDPRIKFPKPHKVGNGRTNLWDAAEVDAWIAAQFARGAEAA